MAYTKHTLYSMKKFILGIVLVPFLTVTAQTVTPKAVNSDKGGVPTLLDTKDLKDLGTFTEYFILDEIRDLRIRIETVKREVNQDLNAREFRISDRALSYTANAITYFSFFLTLALGLFAVFGWRTVKDLKNSAKSIVETESNKLLEEFKGRLETIEADLKEKGEEIISNQEELERVQMINALWVQASRENDDRQKLDILEQIREANPDNPEALVAKAASYLRLDIPDQALEMCNDALDISPDHASAIYNRACSYAQLGRVEESLQDLHYAIQLSEHFKETAANDRDFESLRKNKEFKALID